MASVFGNRKPAKFIPLSKRQSTYDISIEPFVSNTKLATGPGLHSAHSTNSLESSNGGLHTVGPHNTDEHALDVASGTHDIKEVHASVGTNSSLDEWMPWKDPESNALSPLFETLSVLLKFEEKSPNIASVEPMEHGGPIEYEDPIDLEASFTTPFPQDMRPPETPPREGPYFTPLPSERPTPSSHAYSSTISPIITYGSSTSIDSSTIFSIAMGKPSQTSQPQSPTLSPSCSLELPSRSLKHRNSSLPSTSHPPIPRRQAPKKTPHNMIEKRHRDNLKDKITGLRDSVPSLRLAASTAQNSKSNSNSASVPRSSFSDAARALPTQPTGPPPKLNKASVISKATEYIAHLEAHSRVLSAENQHLKARIEAFETLLMGTANAGTPIYEIERRLDGKMLPLETTKRGGKVQLAAER